MKYLFVLLLLLSSCATRKVVKEEVKIDKVEVVQNNIQTKENIDIKIVDSISEICIEPIDTIKPMIIDGKTYVNAKIRYKKQKVNTSIVSNKTTSDLSTKKITEKVAVFKKDTERESIFNWWWLVLITVIIIIIYKVK